MAVENIVDKEEVKEDVKASRKDGLLRMAGISEKPVVKESLTPIEVGVLGGYLKGNAGNTGSGMYGVQGATCSDCYSCSSYGCSSGPSGCADCGSCSSGCGACSN